MIKIIQGDLLNAKEDIIGHQVNCRGVMGSGVAEQVKETYPKAFERYSRLVTSYNQDEDLRHTLLGDTQIVKIANGKYIANLFGQSHYGYDGKQYTDIEALYRCFKFLRNNAEQSHLSVALPYMIGCYRGGADWKRVEDLLLTAFDGYEVTLYKFHKG